MYSSSMKKLPLLQFSVWQAPVKPRSALSVFNFIRLFSKRTIYVMKASRKTQKKRKIKGLIRSRRAQWEVRGWRLICCQLSLRWRCWKGDMWEWINAWMQRWSIRCSLILWASELNRMHRLLALSSWMISPSGIASSCRVSRSEVHFSTANTSAHKYWQCIPSCRLHWKIHIVCKVRRVGLDVGNLIQLCNPTLNDSSD